MLLHWILSNNNAYCKNKQIKKINIQQQTREWVTITINWITTWMIKEIQWKWIEKKEETKNE